MRLSQCWLFRDWGGEGGRVCLGFCVILIPLLSLSPEREPGEKQQPGHSQSRQIVGVPGMQRKDTEAREWSTHMHTHTCMAHFVAFVCASLNKCHFRTERWKFPIKLLFGCECNYCQLWSFFYVSSEPKMYTSNKYWLNWWSTIVSLGVLTSYHAVLYTACAATKLGRDWVPQLS